MNWCCESPNIKSTCVAPAEANNYVCLNCKHSGPYLEIMYLKLKDLVADWYSFFESVKNIEGVSVPTQIKDWEGELGLVEMEFKDKKSEEFAQLLNRSIYT